MAAQTTFIHNLLTAALKGGTYTGGTIKMGLFKTGLPSATGVEVTGGSYARQTLAFGVPASKRVTTSANIVFSNLPTTGTIVAYGIYDGTTLIDERLLSTPFTPDVSNNELDITYYFEITGS